MRAFLIAIFLFGSLKSWTQHKYVKIESEKIYITFFYKQHTSTYLKNDSVNYICTRITDSSFVLSKYVQEKNKSVSYKTVQAQEPLIISTKTRNKNGNYKMRRKLKAYYIGVKID